MHDYYSSIIISIYKKKKKYKTGEKKKEKKKERWKERNARKNGAQSRHVSISRRCRSSVSIREPTVECIVKRTQRYLICIVRQMLIRATKQTLQPPCRSQTRRILWDRGARDAHRVSRTFNLVAIS